MYFSKYNQVGNDFIIFDDRQEKFPISNKSFLQFLSHRKYGIGSDGIILLQNSEKCDYRARIFNSDGFEVESCGNGISCLGFFLKEKKLISSSAYLELMDSEIKINVFNQKVTLFVNMPTDMSLNKSMCLDKGLIVYHCINTGVPHFVSFVNQLEKVDMKNIGKTIRMHENFAPKGTNVNFVYVKDYSSIQVRTYERGVEDETLGCGTGAIACALISSRVHCLKSPISVTHPGGSVEVDFSSSDYVSLVGRPRKVFTGFINLKNGDEK